MKSSRQTRNGLPIIKCRCGTEILLLPDVKLMGTAVEAHVEHHRRKLKGRKDADLQADQIADDLVMQVLTRVLELEELPSKSSI